MRFLSGDTVGGGGVGAERRKTKEPKMCGAVNAEHHKSVLGGKTRQEGEGKEDG